MMLRIRSGQLCAVAAAISAGTASAASAQSSSSLDVGAGVGYSTNPYLSLDDDTNSAFGRVFVEGRHSRATELTVIGLSAYAEHTVYSGGNNSNQLASLNGSVRHRASANVDVFGLLGATINSGGQLSSRFIDFPVGPVATPQAPVGGGTPPPPPVTPAPAPIVLGPNFVTDPTFIGFRGNQYSVRGLVGASFKVNARDSISVQAGTQHFLFEGDAGQDYTIYSLGGGWDRVLSERTVIGAGVDASFVNYEDGGDSAFYSPNFRVRTSLAENWVASAAVGASIVNSDDDDDDDRSIGLYLTGSLCRSVLESSFCGSVQRSAAPSSNGVIVTATNAGVSYNRRLTVNDSIQASANYVRYSGDDIFDNTVTSFGSADVGYNKRLSGRLWSTAQVGARVADRREGESATDVNASLSVRYRFGDTM